MSYHVLRFCPTEINVLELTALLLNDLVCRGSSFLLLGENDLIITRTATFFHILFASCLPFWRWMMGRGADRMYQLQEVLYVEASVPTNKS